MPPQHWDVSKNLIPHRNIIGAMKHELTLFACVQKEARGLDLAIEKAKQRMARYGIEPNMLIMVPETQLYITMVPTEMRQHFERGERGPSQYDSYAGNRTWASFRGLDCFTTNPFDSGDNVDSVQMLRRNTQVGEFYVMAPPYTWESSTALPKTYMGARRARPSASPRPSACARPDADHTLCPSQTSCSTTSTATACRTSPSARRCCTPCRGSSRS